VIVRTADGIPLGLNPVQEWAVPRTGGGGPIVLIVILALWLVAISLVLRFIGVSVDLRCAACGGELELWPESRHCPDCGKQVAMPRRRFSRVRRGRRDAEVEAIHALVASVVQGGLNRSRRHERAHPLSPPVHYQRASSGNTRSAKSRTLS
jgi:hypothetical protein